MTTALTTELAEKLDEGHRPGTPAYWRIVASLFVAGVATFALLYSTQAILPTLSSQFGVSSAAATLTVSLTTLGLGAALLVTGPFSDVYGRTTLIHLSLAASAIAGIVCALAPNWPALLTLRLLEGVLLAGLPAVATAYLREELHASTHARAAGLYVGGTALGGMAGRLVTGAVAEYAGWRWALAATGLLALACALTVRMLLPSSRRFSPISRHVRSVSVSPLRALSDRGLLALYVVGCCSAGALVAMFNALGFRLEAAPFHLGSTATSLVFLVYPLGAVSSTVFGRLADSFGRAAMLPIGCVVAIGGILLTVPASLPAVVVGVALLTAGFFAVHGVASGWVPVRAHESGIPTGQAASLYLFAFYLGSSVFGSLAGSAWSFAGWSGVVVLTLALFVVSGVCTVLLRRHRETGGRYFSSSGSGRLATTGKSPV